MTTPTARTLALLRSRGWLAAVVERRLPYGHTTKDLFGFADIVAVHPELGTLAVQATTVANQAARVLKLQGLQEPLCCIRAGWAIQVWGWRKYAARVDGRLWRATVAQLRPDGRFETVQEGAEGGPGP